MAEQTYNYTISTDFPNAVVSASKLQSEVISSSVKVALKGIYRVGDNLSVVFKAPLDNADETALGLSPAPGVGTVIGDHQGVSDPKPDAVIIEPTGDLSKSILASGFMFTAAPNDVTNMDASWPDDRDVQGGYAEISGHESGDYANVVAVHPVTGASLGHFLENVYVPPSGVIDIQGEGTTFIPAGVIFRIQYHATAAGGTRTLYFTVKTWR